MKFTSQDYAILNHALTVVGRKDGETIDTLRKAWDKFHEACDRGLIPLNHLYRYYNDDHIETALRRAYSIR